MISKFLAPAWMILVLGTAHAQPSLPTDFLTYEGVWTTVPLTGLSAPSAVTGDAAGNLYVTDTGASSIFKLAADGVTQSSVGSGLSSPEGVAVDSSGNIYVTSNGDNKVYKITSGGTQTSFGSGWNAPVSVAVDSNGNVFVTDSSGLWEVTSGSSPSNLVESSHIRGVAVDSSNNIYYGDNLNQHVFEIPVGTSSATELNSTPFVQGLYVDAAGNVFSAQTSAGVYRADDNIGDYTLFGDTTITYGVWGDSHQNLYIADHSGKVEKLAMGPVDFGSVNVCPNDATVTPCSSTQTLHFALDSLVTASPATQALTQGFVGADYTADNGCTGDLVPGGACAVTVTFAPQGAGLRTGAVEAVGSSFYNTFAPPVGPHPRVNLPVRPRDEPANTLLGFARLHGIGLAPAGVFNTAPITTIPALLPNSYPISLISGPNVLFVVDQNNCVVQLIADGSSVVAGTTCAPASGDGGLATAATLQRPWGLVLDGAGNLYISDTESRTIRKVDPRTGLISTIAGTGSSGNTGDGGPATSATFVDPEGLALDSAGNLFVADYAADVVRRIDAVTGIITTFAGTGSAGEAGDGGPASSADLNAPDALAMDKDGNLYIADDNANVIRKVAAGTNIITTIAGTGTAGYSGDGGPATSAKINDPEGLAVDPAGNLYIADSSNYLVRKVDVSTGIITTAAGVYNSGGTETYTGDGGEAILAGMSYLEDVAVSSDGQIVVADSDNHVLRVVTAPQGLASFGSIALGSSSTAQDVTFSNVGTSSLIATSLQVPTNFSTGGADTTCTSSSTLTSGAGCVMGIELVPTADGSLTGNLTIADNEGNHPAATQTVALSGTGTGAAPAKLAFMGAIPTIVAGGNLGTVTVAVEDAGSNVVTGATSTVTLIITGPDDYSHTVTVAAVNGVASFNLSALPLTAAGTYTLTATSPSLTQAQATASVSAGNPATPAELAIPNTVATTIPAGGSIGIVPVDIENSLGAVLPSATNSVTLTITGPGGYTHSVTVSATNGVANFNLSSLSLTTPGTYTLTATSAGLTEATATLTVTAVTPTTPVQLSIASPVPANIGAGGNPGVVVVNVENSAGAVIPSATNSVTLTLTGPGGYSHVVTVAAVAGVASFDFTSLALTTPGTYTLTATSGNLTAAIATFTITIDFTIAFSAGSVTTANIPPGGVAVYAFTLAPATSSFPLPIALTATGLPAGATYSFSPATVTPGASPAPTVLTVQTVRSASASMREVTGWGTTIAFGFLLLPISASRRMRRSFRRGPLMSIVLALLALGTVAGLAGCGAGGLFGQSQQTYTITVTGTSGSLSHSATVTLTVQ